MFFSLVQTLVCVLLINGGMYALHLTGSGNTNSAGAGGGHGGGGAAGSGPMGQANSASMMHLLPPPSNGGGQHLTHGSLGGHQMGLKNGPAMELDSGRLSKQLADMAQSEREKLMFLGMAKQTAAAAAAGGTGLHGRPIIPGRIQMTPTDDVESDYAAVMMQQPRAFMFGNVVKHPSQTDDYELDEDFDGGGGVRSAGGSGRRRRPVKYEYGRVVQPQDHEFDDLDSFHELENEPLVDELIPDLETYQYMEEDDLKWDGEQADSPYYGPSRHGGHLANPLDTLETLEELEAQAPLALQELFEKEQRAEEALKHSQGIKQRPGFNIKMHQKWQRKRAQLQQTQQQKEQWQRNIFGHTKPQLHHFNPLAHGKFAENTVGGHHKESGDILASDSGITLPLNHQKHEERQEAGGPSASSSAAATSSASAEANSKSPSDSPKGSDDKDDDELSHPNHKRSGIVGGATGSSAAAAYGNMPPVSHSIASQLMLRSVRGQRQYDVPQIECPTAMDGMERFACPTPDLQGRYRCIDDHVLCDGFIDCPEGEDEDRRSCMFYKTTKAHLDVLADALLRWARGR